MAKSTTSSKRKVAVFSIKGWDAAHYKTTNQYANAVQRIMVATTNDISRMVAGKTIDTDKPFSFADYPAIQREVDKAVADMANTMTMTIEKGSRKEWLSATRKGDAFLDSIMTTSKVSKKRLQTMQDKNLDALSAFQSRKVDGMNLSQRVWKYAGQFKDQIEQCIDVGLGEGRSADELSRDVRQNLKDPNRLFRRVRDKRGNLVLSKNARAFHPGQGVYRSSYKNAMRLTRSEINMAYRESDYLRWQQLDFVIGIEIHRSNHEPLCECKMCERLQGKYPKTFKFKGWHPQCMCYATPILVTDDEFDAQELSDLKSALHGTEYKKLAVKGEITDVPDGFKSWVDDNKDASKNWKSVPYFVKDNFVDGELAKGLKPAAMQSKAVEEIPDEPVNHVPYDQLDKEAQRHWRNFLYDHFPVNYDWKEACRLYGIPGIDEYVQHIDSAYDNNEYWRESELIAEQARIDAALKAEIERCHEQAKQGIADYVAALKDSFKWVGAGDKSYIQYSYDYMSKEATEKYPNYKAVINALNGGSFDVQRLQNKVTAAKDAYNAAISSAKGIVAKYTGQVDVSKLESLIAEQISESRPAVTIIRELETEIKKVEQQALGLQKYIGELTTKGVEYKAVEKHAKQPTEQELIDSIGGGDMTSGSCSSLAFTWAANRGGMNVLDFRGGKSLDYFSSGYNIRMICDAVGGINEYMSGVDAMKRTVIGKEYYLAIGRHAAIVRQVAPKQYEYLELQSGVAGRNGWHKLNAAEFGHRFSARGREYAQLIDVELLYKNKDYQNMMGYINTAESDQKKGSRGTIK